MTVPQFLHKFQTDEPSFGPHWGQIERQIEFWVQEDEFDTLRGIVQTLLDETKTRAPQWKCRAVLNKLVGELAFSTRWQCAAFLFEIDALLEFADFETKSDLSPTQRPITISSLLIAGQDEVTLHRLFEHFGNGKRHQVLLALLAQEMVLRQQSVINTPVESFWRDKVVAGKHPLGWLPLHLVAHEQNISEYLPERGVNYVGWLRPFDDFDPTLAGPACESHLQVEPREVDQERFVGLLQQPGNGGNRRFAFARYSVGNLSNPAEFSVADLLRLDFKWLRSTQASNVNLRSSTPTEAFRFLFHTASMGGNYGVDAGSAWGRLRAWKALGELIEAPEDASLEEIAARSAQFVWHSFIADAKADGVWFVGLRSDFGLIAIAPDANHVTVLASTDCD